MLTQLKGLWVKWNTVGIRLPFCLDVSTGKPSITLLIFYTMFVINIISLVWLHFDVTKWLATGYSLMAFVISFVFYRLQRLNNVKIDVKDGEIELDGEEEKE